MEGDVDVVYKYTLAVVGEQAVTVPKSAKVISAGQDHNGHVCVWAVCNDSEEVALRKFYLIPTGNKVELDLSKLSFVGTVIERHRPLVWHVFQQVGSES